MNAGDGLLIAAASIVSGIACAWRAPRVWLGLTLLGCGAALVAAVMMLAGAGVWELRSALLIGGERVHLLLDGERKPSAPCRLLLHVRAGASWNRVRVRCDSK